ncbi:MAG TPA: D-erythronate dehydrogenase [Jatrophihabitans sp.]|nr:D-erythronate dehydrogenase [Jatrophihabitans sp.]
MHIVVTGGAGFLGTRLCRELLAVGSLSAAGAPQVAIERLTVLDRAAPAADVAADPRVTASTADLLDAGSGAAHPVEDADVVFHLAAAVSGECERDFDLGMRTNLDGTLALLRRCRASGRTPVVVFASSLAVFGSTAGYPMPAVVTDETLPVPQTSYGIQKFVCEQLLADYTRKGFLRGRSVRLPTVSVRPGRPNTAASSYLSGIIREPLNGKRADCPVDPDVPAAICSPDAAIRGLLRAATAGPDEWGAPLAVTLPAITVTAGEMVSVLAQVAGADVAALVDWRPDETIASIVRGWPSRLRTDRAAGLGLPPDESFAAIVHAHIRGMQPAR